MDFPTSGYYKLKYDILELKSIIEEYEAETHSPKAKRILENFETYLPLFKKIIPHDYAVIRRTVLTLEERGMNSEQAEIEAFYLNTREGA